jgi:broad specificity phosphatase PhoE
MVLSKIKKIYIIRHGETDYNRHGIVQGSGVDSDLNELGNSQAEAFYQYYKHINFDKIYSSKLKRTHQSVKGFIAKKLNWVQHEGLNEICWGTREGKLPNENDNFYFSKTIKLWREGNTEIAFEGGESPNEVAARQTLFLEIMKEQKAENTILVAMHGRALRILLANIIDNDLSKMDEYEHTNLCLYIVNYNYDSNTYHLQLSNDTAHLNCLNNTQ